jgi:hypothetical protein
VRDAPAPLTAAFGGYRRPGEHRRRGPARLPRRDEAGGPLFRGQAGRGPRRGLPRVVGRGVRLARAAGPSPRLRRAPCWRGRGRPRAGVGLRKLGGSRRCVRTA